MTSTPFNVGLTDNTRLSSRVLRPPGGGHTDIFGGEPEPTRGRRAGPPQQPTYVIGQGDEPKPTNGASEAPQNGTAASVQETPASTPEAPQKIEVSQKTEAPLKIDTSPKESPMTQTQAIQPPAKVEPPKRVRVPPGGFSSGLW